MLSNGFATTIHLRRRPSRLLAAYLILIHLLALLALLQPLDVPGWLRVVGFGVVLLSIAWHSRQYFRLSDSDVGVWTWNSDGNWRYGAEQELFVVQKSGVVNTPWFVLVRLSALHCSDRRRLLIIRDQLDENDFRRVRVRLRFFHDEAIARRVAAL